MSRVVKRVSRVVKRVPSGRSQAHVTKVPRGCQEGVTKEHCVEGVTRASRGVKRESRECCESVERLLIECWICCFA